MPLNSQGGRNPLGMSPRQYQHLRRKVGNPAVSATSCRWLLSWPRATL
jgi:hypothetical protein